MSDFSWNDELVKKFVAEKIILGNCTSAKEALEQFKEKHTKPKVEWEIVRVRNKYHNTHVTHNLVEIDGRKFINDQNYDYVLNCLEHKYTIESVRRLSDQEVFSIGDEVEAKYWGRQTIVGFDVLSNGGLVNFATCRNPITDLKKVTKPIPLLVTEDGVEIFDRNEVVYSVCAKGQWEENYTKAHYALNRSSAWKNFSSKEKREDYILTNRPLLSIVDLIYAFPNNVLIMPNNKNGSIDLLRKLAKEKLSK
jgi:hypothetical protein